MARKRLARVMAAGLLAAAIFLSTGCGTAGGEARDPFAATGELIALSGAGAGAAYACFTCHGLDGAGNGAGAPRLAGLGVGYLNRQMDDYAAGRRRHAEMEYVAKRMSAPERQRVAAYYAALPTISPPVADTPILASPLYAAGDPSRGLAACASCHGARGEGVGPGNPPLAGQSAEYLAAQLHAWRLGTRRGDAENVMQQISRRITPEEIRSVSTHAAALAGTALRPGPRAASREARRADPRNDASAPPPRAAARAR
jgi:cytochrome c553